MNTKDQWINQTMESLDGAGRAGLSPSIREKIPDRIQAPWAGTDSVAIGLVWKIAAVILLLISLNVFTLTVSHRSSGNTRDSAKSVASEYFSYIDNYNL